MDYGEISLTKKANGYQKTTLVELDGEFELYFRDFDQKEYCGQEDLFVTTWRDTPRYGGALDPWLTIYAFNADTFEKLAEVDAPNTDITEVESGFIPESPSFMAQRYLVSCLPAERGHPFSFGLIDRKALYGPDWCGPGGTRCEVH